MKDEEKAESTSSSVNEDDKEKKPKPTLKQRLENKLMKIDQRAIDLKVNKSSRILGYQKPDFYIMENRMDKNKRRPDDPEYDPTSIYIPLNQFQ